MAGFNWPDAGVPHPFCHQLRKHLLPLAIVLLTGIIAYSNSLNGPFQFDDVAISNEAYLLSRASTSTARQFADFSFLLNHYLHGAHVFGFHLLNLIIHLCSAVIIYFLATDSIRALAGNELSKPEDGQLFILRFVPFATALLFACHPIQTQAVTYIVQRYTSLATLFYLLSILLFVKARISSLNSSCRKYIWLAGIGSVISGLVAMRCKEIAFTLPVMMIVVELFIFRGRLLRNRFFLSGMAVLMLIILVQQVLLQRASGISDLVYSISRGTREELTYSRIDYFLTQLRVVVTYVRLLLFPVNQNLDYDYPLLKVFFSAPVIVSLMFHVLMLMSAAFLFFKSRLHLNNSNLLHGVCFRLCSFGIVWFYVALLVESSFIPIVDVIFEHRIYLPSFGFFLAIVSVTAGFVAHREATRKIVWIGLAVICLVLTTATIRRNLIWSDDLLLWEDTVSKSPHKPRALNNLAAAYLTRNMPEKAIDPLLYLLKRDPGSIKSLSNLDMLLDQIPHVKGRYSNGSKYLTHDEKVDVRYMEAWYANSCNSLGLVYELKGDHKNALANYEKAVVIAPNVEIPWLNIAFLSLQQGSNQRAIEAYEKLKQLNPGRAKEIEAYIFRKK